MRTTLTLAAAVIWTTAPSIAFAQRFPFQRSFDVAGPSKLDVSTLRGKIEIVAGDEDRIVVDGVATVRVGWNVPANAIELARQVAAAPPVDRQGDAVRLRPPSDDEARRAVTVSFQVRVPRTTEVRTDSDSGATSVRGVAGAVDVRTQSAAITLNSLGGAATVSTGSGAVNVEDIAGGLTVKTDSGSFTATGVGSSLRLRTQSGAVNAASTGTGDVDVETGSSAIRLTGLGGGLTAKTQSGRVIAQGKPGGEWVTTTGSSAVDFDIEPRAGFSLDASSRSGSVIVEGARVQGSESKHEVKGTVDGGGPLLRIVTGSGAIRIKCVSGS